jgi:hypothetical protein
MKLGFNIEDISPIVIGSVTLAVPVSFSGEAWIFGALLAFSSILLILFMSAIPTGRFCPFSGPILVTGHLVTAESVDRVF